MYKDFHVYSVQRRIPAQVFVLAGDASVHRDYRWMIVKCEKPVLEKVKKLATATLREYLPDNPYSFIDYGERNFKTGTLNKVKAVEKAFGFFTFIAIIIACMGIFGLVALTVKGKTKEIGIRKVLGSSAVEIFSLSYRHKFVGFCCWLYLFYITYNSYNCFSYDKSCKNKSC